MRLAVDNPFLNAVNEVEEIQGNSDTLAAQGGFLEALGSIMTPIMVVVAILGVILIVQSGMKIVFGPSDPAKVDEAKKQMLYYSIGLAILVASYSIALFLFRTLANP